MKFDGLGFRDLVGTLGSVNTSHTITVTITPTVSLS